MIMTTTENTPVTVTLPLGLLRTTLVALACYLECIEESWNRNNHPVQDENVLCLIAKTTELFTLARAKVAPQFEKTFAVITSIVSLKGLLHLWQLEDEGRTSDEAIEALLQRQADLAERIATDVKARGVDNPVDVLGVVREHIDAQNGTDRSVH